MREGFLSLFIKKKREVKKSSLPLLVVVQTGLSTKSVILVFSFLARLESPCF